MSDTASAEPQFTDLTAFNRDLLFAVRNLEADYNEELNHSWLYQNLDKLVAAGLLTKNKRDGRTNEYATPIGAHQNAVVKER